MVVCTREDSRAELTVAVFSISSVTCPYSSLSTLVSKACQSFPEDRTIDAKSPNAKGLVCSNVIPGILGRFGHRSALWMAEGSWAMFTCCSVSSYFVLLARMLWNKYK